MEERINWMEKWAKKNRLKLDLDATCGFARPCVGIKTMDTFPDYEWHDKGERSDENGNVWIPERAYHKHPCVAVLGTDEESICQLYDWLKWFDKHNFKYRRKAVPCDSYIEELLGKNFHHMMVREPQKKISKKPEVK